MPFKYASMEDRLLANSVISQEYAFRGTPCWDWIARRNAAGYGMMAVRWKSGPKKGKLRTVYAHRVSAKVFKGAKASTRNKVAHYCGRQCCINPEHLRYATQKTNVRDNLRNGTHANRYGRTKKRKVKL